MTKRAAAGRGFTLIEILLVLTVIGIMSAAVLPNLSRSFGRSQFKTAANDAALLLRYAQTKALIAQQPYRLVISDDRKQFWLEREIKDQSGAAPAQYEKISGNFGRVFKVPEGISLTAEQLTAGIFPDGTFSPVSFKFCQAAQCLQVDTTLQKGQVHVLEQTEGTANE